MNPVAQSYRAIKPPAYPRYEKASTVRLTTPRNAPLPSPKKIQRDPDDSNSAACLSPAPSLPSSLALPPAPPSSDAKLLRRQEYQQYTRKNYFRSRRKGAQGEDGSRLTEQALPADCSCSAEQQKRLKSKSALSYAKYFIKHVSVIPTEPSSNPPARNDEPPLCPEEDHKKNSEQSPQKKSTSIFSHEDRQKSRKKISERLKSIKNTRARQKPTSIERDKEGRSEKDRERKTERDREGKAERDREGRSEKEARGKIAGNIGSLEGNESNVLRMKARARNRRVVLKVKQMQSRAAGDELCLLMSSKVERSFEERREVVEKVELHLELLNLLPAYVKEFKEIYEESECWEELIFLVYKKFYVERLKVQLALADHAHPDLPATNPFRFPFCLLHDRDLDLFRNSLHALRLEEKLTAENAAIKDSLRNLYNHIIEKSGKHVNLYEVDNFSEEVYYLMNEELKLLAEETDGQGVRERRSAFIMKCALMMAFLNGERVEVDAVLTENTCSQRMSDAYHDFIDYYTQ